MEIYTFCSLQGKLLLHRQFSKILRKCEKISIPDICEYILYMHTITCTDSVCHNVTNSFHCQHCRLEKMQSVAKKIPAEDGDILCRENKPLKCRRHQPTDMYNQRKG